MKIKNVKEKNRDNTNTTNNVGSQSIKDDSAARIVEESKGVESNIKGTYVGHIPPNSSEAMVKHFRRLVAALDYHNQEFKDEVNTVIKEALLAAKTSKDLNDLEDYVQDLASQGEVGKELYEYYQENIEELKEDGR